MTNDNGKQWQIYVAGIVLSLFAAVIAIQWQTSIDATNTNQAQIEKMEQVHKEDIARLDESNRNRRNQIADLEERIARVEERTGG